jgi:hypothetical protein
MVAEWEEHDTWPSTNHYYRWHFACPICATEYAFYPEDRPYMVRRKDADQHRDVG